MCLSPSTSCHGQHGLITKSTAIQVVAKKLSFFSLRFPSNSEAFASELLGNLEEIYLLYW